MISLQSVSHAFGSHPVLDDVSLTLESGQVTGLLGINGAGKTTLLRILCGILVADHGAVLWDGRPMNDADRQQMGYLPEERGLYPHMRVDEQLVYWGRLKGLSDSEARRRAAQWLERLQIADAMGKKPAQLSKGMQQKIQLAAALIHNPRCVVLDEPFSGLDPINAQLLRAIVADLRSNGTTLLLSSHNMNFVEECCDRVAMLHHTRMIYQGSLADLLAQHPGATLNDIFLQQIADSNH